MREGSLLSDLGYLSFLSSSNPHKGGKESTVYIHTQRHSPPKKNNGSKAGVLLVLLLSVYVSVSKNSFLALTRCFGGKAAAKVRQKINTHQIFRQLFSYIERIFNTLLTKIKDKGKKKGELIII